jgi:hypothetical protein
VTHNVDVTGSAKGPAGWFPLRAATVYLDHPVHAAAEHTLNIDFLNPQRGPAARVALELTEDSARELAAAILRSLPDLGAGHNSAAAGPNVPTTSG